MPTKAEHEALKLRQGDGARYDAENAPAGDLLLARRGAAVFARELNTLSNADLKEPSRLDGISRAQIVLQTSYQARALAIALRALSKPLSQEEKDWTPDISLSLSMPPHALRHLYAHSDVHLNVEFRDLLPENWSATISYGGQATLPVALTPILRGQTIWTAAFDLGTGVQMGDLPPAFQSPDTFNKRVALER